MPATYEAFVATTEKEREELFRFRYQVFVEEQHKYVNVADHERRRFADAMDDDAVQLCVTRDGVIVASMRQIRGAQKLPPALCRTYQIDRFPGYEPEQFGFSGRLLVLPEQRGSRALLHLLRLVYSSGRDEGVLLDFINCNPHLVKLYEQLGYRRYQPSYEDPNLGYQIPLVLLTDDREHLQRVRSPFLEMSSNYSFSSERTPWFEAAFPDFGAVVSPLGLGEEHFVEYLSRKVNTSDVPLLRAFNEDEVQTLLGLTTHLRVASGSRLVRQGDMGQEVFVILEGVAEVRRQGEQKRRLLATLGRGDVFGEMSVLTSRVRSADVIATTDLEVMYLDQATLRKLMAGSPALASKLLLNFSQILAERLEITSTRVA